MMRIRACVAFLFIYQLALSEAVPPRDVSPTVSTVDRAKMIIEYLIRNDPKPHGINTLIGGFVRLSFHDCVGKGGCDGCIDHDNPSNRGLKPVTETLDKAYEDNFYRFQISRADFYMLSGIVALEVASSTTKDKFVGGKSFLGGRKDCSTSPNEDDTNENLPSANLDLKGVTKFFFSNFGFRQRETIALMGAHTVGRASLGNSGHNGSWTVAGENTGPNILDNNYYNEIVNVPWFQTSLSSGKFQWIVPPAPNMLLNVDASLSLNLTLDENGKSQCVMCARRNTGRPGDVCCPKNRGDAICVEFAANNAKWLTEFTHVFMKMINRSSAHLFLPREFDWLDWFDL